MEVDTELEAEVQTEVEVKRGGGVKMKTEWRCR